MRSFPLVFAAFLAALMVGHTPQRGPRIFVIADSIARPANNGLDNGVGWAPLMEGNVRVVPENAMTSANTLARLNQWIVPADVILLGVGLWDRWAGVSDEQYRHNLLAIGTRLKATGARVYFLTATPVRDGGRWGANTDIERMNAVAVGVMDELGIEVIDLYSFSLPYRDQLLDDAHWDPWVSARQAVFISESLQ